KWRCYNGSLITECTIHSLGERLQIQGALRVLPEPFGCTQSVYKQTVHLELDSWKRFLQDHQSHYDQSGQGVSPKWDRRAPGQNRTIQPDRDEHGTERIGTQEFRLEHHQERTDSDCRYHSVHECRTDRKHRPIG